MAADVDKISVPRPKPGDVLIAITDAEGASAWTSCPKADLGELGPGLLSYLEEGQQLVHEQRAADGRRTDGHSARTGDRLLTDHPCLTTSRPDHLPA